MTVFSRLQPNEQHHAVQVLRRLISQGETHPDLQVAALLHDVGKSQAPLAAWERALIVLAGRIMPNYKKDWGSVQETRLPPSWRKAFIVAEEHPRWGARIAREAGATPLAEALIRRHQDPLPDPPGSLEERLLRKLQSADDDS
jgi:hypothetical protein